MAKSIISNNPAQLVTKARANLTDWTSYTPTIQGLGTVTSLQADWIQIGSKIHVKGYCTVGTPTAEEIQVSLPNSYTVGGSITNGVVPTGKMLIHGSSNTRLHFLSTFGDSFVNIGTEFRTAVSNGENPVLGNAVLNPGQTVSFDFEVPVQELSGSDVTFLAAQPTQRVAYIKDVKADSVSGGTFTGGAWQTRDLNTTEGDTEFISVSSNQITLQPGKYQIKFSAPAVLVNSHQTRLRNITDSTSDILGTREYTASSDVTQNRSFGEGIIEIGSAKTYELQHRCITTRSSDGFGRANGDSFGESVVYTQIEITKLK